MKIIAYIDAFNFYYGLTKNTPYKWCNLWMLCQELLPEGDVTKVKLFTAYSRDFPEYPGQARRQNTYFRALETIPQIEIIKSKYTVDKKFLPLCGPEEESQSRKVMVKVSKEKGSDVNLATHLLVDAYKDLFEMAAVFTNDSDLALPLKAVRYEFNKKIYLMITVREGHRSASKQLLELSNYHKLITPEMLAKCQLPERVITKQGKIITIPDLWKTNTN